MSSLKDCGVPEYVENNDLNLARTLGRTLRTVDNFVEAGAMNTSDAASDDDDITEANNGNSQSDSAATSTPGVGVDDLSDTCINEDDYDFCDVEAPNSMESNESGASRSRPGAYRIAGIDAPTDLNDEDLDDFIVYNNSSSMEDADAPPSSVPSITTATLVEADDDRSFLLNEIRQLRAERENVAQAEAVVLPIEDIVDNQDESDEGEKQVVQQHRCFPTRRRTLLCLLLVVCIAGLVFGIVIGVISLRAK